MKIINFKEEKEKRINELLDRHLADPSLAIDHMEDKNAREAEISVRNINEFILGLRKEPESIELLLGLADEVKNLAYSTGKTPSCAHKIYGRILSLNPSEYRAIDGLAGFYYLIDDLDNAERLYHMALEHAPDDSQFKLLTYRTLADIYSEKGDHKRAEEYYQKALEIKDARSIKETLAEMYITACKFELGIASLEAIRSEIEFEAVEVSNEQDKRDFTRITMTLMETYKLVGKGQVALALAEELKKNPLKDESYPKWVELFNSIAEQ